MPSLQCSCAFCHKTCARLLLYSPSFCCTFCGIAICTTTFSTHLSLSIFLREYPLHLCPFSPHLKYSTTLSPASLLSFPLCHTISLYSSILQIYSRELFSPFSPSVSCNFGLGAQMLCNSNILFLSFLLTLPLMKQECAFL